MNSKIINQLKCLVALVGAVLLISCGYPPLREGHAPITTGEPVIQALENYRALNGAYPKSLQELVPAYLQKIPTPEIGVNQWTYEYYNANHYNLSVLYKNNSYESIIYDNKKRRWWVDQ